MFFDQDQYETLRSRIEGVVGEGHASELESIMNGLEGLRKAIYSNNVTGAPNMLQRDEDLDKVFENGDNRREEGNPHQIYAVMIDIDNFGQFNKLYGSEIGDKVLQGVMEIITETLRNDDVVVGLSDRRRRSYHLHGEEMLAIYACENLDNALNVAERVRARVEKKSKEETGYSVTVSLGVAEWISVIENYSVAQRRADHDMQIAKRDGRNRVYCRDKDPLFELKEKFYQPGLTDAAAETFARSVKTFKGILGRTATSLCLTLDSFYNRLKRM